jgi:catechol 2,3-dioxygenase-like lactoylglutathione lyase family enzyme
VPARQSGGRVQIKRSQEGFMKPRISMIALAVADLERSVAFYEDGLGLPRMASPPQVAFFNLDGTWLGLSERDVLAADATVSPAGSGYAGFNLAHNVADKSEVDAVLEQAEAAGATIVKPAQDASWGGYHGYFADPDGQLWEVAFNPFAWIGPEDRS